MNRLLVSAAHKSSGKTTLCVGLCAALRARGHVVQPFKKGPDFIDPMWLSLAAGREGHYMPLSLLRSQFDTLEEPTDAIVVSVELSPEQAVLEIVRALNRAAHVSTDAGQTTSPRSHGP